MKSIITTFVLLVVWIVGMATGHTAGGLLHVVPIAALIVFGVSMFRGINDFQHIDFGT